MQSPAHFGGAFFMSRRVLVLAYNQPLGGYMSKISASAAWMAIASMTLATAPVSAKNTKAYDHAIECSSAVAVVAALVGDDPETKDIAAQMKAATPKWLDIGRAMKLKSDDAVMEDHKAAVTQRLKYILEDESPSGDRAGELAKTAIECLDEVS